MHHLNNTDILTILFIIAALIILILAIYKIFPSRRSRINTIIRDSMQRYSEENKGSQRKNREKW